ncbi:hypothetical protein BU14_1910s0001 [Porphyra umbilicalis]|uniref:HTH cro/C1-type domain-containing protein n=1 Tax=Porphyra umbilicalis TaxID=2786 RepID=A0A1X6NKB2_PORUM|nr:hypothetical protein BU14_1910s0001 [Porphyra umbilicalis]|eukprot:OSX69061.1 hypothetical protein BU14_1910s0001 [Porphyra umbilicalis]
MNQDWEPVKIRPKTGSRKADVNAAVRAGGAVVTEKKHGAGSNSRTGDKNLSKLDAETDVLAHATVSMSLSKSIQKARVDKKWSQAQLAQAINEKPAVINQYEAGKALPNSQIISKMERALGTKLRQKK